MTRAVLHPDAADLLVEQSFAPTDKGAAQSLDGAVHRERPSVDNAQSRVTPAMAVQGLMDRGPVRTTGSLSGPAPEGGPRARAGGQEADKEAPGPQRPDTTPPGRRRDAAFTAARKAINRGEDAQRVFDRFEDSPKRRGAIELEEIKNLESARYPLDPELTPEEKKKRKKLHRTAAARLRRRGATKTQIVDQIGRSP